MSDLGYKQKLFMRQVPRLIDKAHDLGFEVTLGDGYRDPRSHGQIGERIAYGAPYSCHKSRLAIDLNLFLNGEYLKHTEDHRALGEWWEAQNPDNCWGGRFNDGNHYSMTHEGRK
jgi:hypothetical protein